jgi:hypothetical protein
MQVISTDKQIAYGMAQENEPAPTEPGKPIKPDPDEPYQPTEPAQPDVQPDVIGDE